MSWAAPSRSSPITPPGSGTTPAATSPTLQFLDVALLVDDPTLLTDYTRWLVDLLDRRGVPQAAVTASLDALAAAIRTHGGELPRATSMLEAARGTLDDDRRQAAAGALPHR